MRADAGSAECSMTGHYYYGSSRLNLWQRIQATSRDASIRMQQISGHKLADLHPGKHWGAPTHPHTEGSKRRVWQQSQACGSTQPAATSGGRRRSRQLGFCPPPDIAAPCPLAPHPLTVLCQATTFPPHRPPCSGHCHPKASLDEYLSCSRLH